MCYFGSNNKQRGAPVSKNCQLFDLFATDNFWKVHNDDGLTMLSPQGRDPCKSTSLSVELPLSEDASSGLTYIVKVEEGSEISDERPEHFSGATINSRLLDSQ